VSYLPLLDVNDDDDLDRFCIGDDVCIFFLSDDSEMESLLLSLFSYDETEDKESSSKFFIFLSLLFVLEFDNGTGGVENKSSKSAE
jgi:hypothetical protein